MNKGKIKTATTAICIAILLGSSVQANELKPGKFVSTDQSVHTVEIKQAAMNYAKFWNTGKEAYAREALLENFQDMPPPKGRKKGIEGVLKASQNFRKVIPNLHVEVEHLLIYDSFFQLQLCLLFYSHKQVYQHSLS